MSQVDFWARRKASVQAEAEALMRQEEIREAAQREEQLAEKPDAEILEDLGLPDPDTLGQGDDFKVFLTQAVPARIRTRALRRLWLTNPVLANVDGLVDYGEDFTDGAKVIDAMQTAYQVGKGMTRHVEEVARQAEADLTHPEAEADPFDDAVAALSQDDDHEATCPGGAGRPAGSAEDTTHAVLGTGDESGEAGWVPRRMRFTFEEARPEA